MRAFASSLETKKHAGLDRKEVGDQQGFQGVEESVPMVGTDPFGDFYKWASWTEGSRRIGK